MMARDTDRPARTGTEQLRFDRYVLHLGRGSLLLDGTEIALRPKTFAVLRRLVEVSGRLVSKDELLAGVWSNLTVTDDALVQSIGELRRALRFGLKPERLAADTALGSAATLDWIVTEKGIAPHIPVFDKLKRKDGTFSREDFTFDKTRNVYICPAFKVLTTTGKVMNLDMLFYRASKADCDACLFKRRCCPKEPSRKLLRSIHEEARDVARAIAKTEAFEQSCRDRKRVEMLFAHLKRILRLGRLRLRGPRGAQFEFTLAAIAQNLRRLAKLLARPPPQPVSCAA